MTVSTLSIPALIFRCPRRLGKHWRSNSGPVNAGCSIGITLSPGNVNLVLVSAKVQWSWEYNDGAYGAFSSVSVSGGLSRTCRRVLFRSGAP